MDSIQRYDNYGIASRLGQPVLTFQVQSAIPTDETLELSALPGSRSNGIARVGDYSIGVYGRQNNLPYELMQTVKANKLLPEILEKQRRYLYGKGPYMYIEQVDTDGNVKRISAKGKYPDVVRRINQWLEGWEESGAKDDFRSYVRKQINEFYYCENVFSKFQMNSARLLNKNMLTRIGGGYPVRYLESMPNMTARLATLKDLSLNDSIQFNDFDTVLVGDWLRNMSREKVAYPLFDRRNRLGNGVSIAMDCNDSFGELIYGYPAWFFGLRDWIRSSNLNPKYINSFLKNSLGAKIHVLIPDSWCRKMESSMEKLCRINAERAIEGKALHKFGGEIEVGTEYRDEHLDKVINYYMNKVTQLMSGEGKNQGKIWASRKFVGPHGTEEWEFKEIPTNVKEYIETILKLDERSDSVILAGKGVDSSLSNVSQDGIISKSGSDLYYNYLLYLNNLQIAEEIILKHLNEAIIMNFPEAEATEMKLGFLHNVIQRQEDVSPDSRMNKTTAS